MKKMILILFILLLGGCYDYNELTDLGIVSSMFIDYENGEYIVNLEILDTNKQVKDPSYFLEGRGKTFENALIDVYRKSTTHVYLHHMDIIVLSESIAEDKLLELYDYFLRDPDIRKDSYFMISTSIDEFFKYKTLDNSSIGEAIKNIIKYNEEENANFKTSLFSEILHNYLNKETYLLGDVVVEDDFIKLKNTYVVEDNKLSLKLDNDAVLLANIINNSPSTFLITLNDAYEVYKYKLDRKVKDNKIIISMDADVRLYGMNKEKTSTDSDIRTQEKKVSEYLKLRIMDSILYSKEIDIDIYNLNYLYYIFKPLKAKDDSWKKIDYEVNVKVSINEKGLIIDTLGDGVK